MPKTLVSKSQSSHQSSKKEMDKMVKKGTAVQRVAQRRGASKNINNPNKGKGLKGKALVKAVTKSMKRSNDK